MPFEKGKSGNPKGKAKGPNKATAQAREAIASFVDGNADRLSGWLDQIAEQDGPKDAFNCFMSVVEYHIPKLARTESKSEIDHNHYVFDTAIRNAPNAADDKT
jgi:hypothetical protein